jgi:predicted ribosomally synthesized peptide with nif11-like leader
MAFLEKASNDYRLRDKIRIANNDSDVVEIAKQSGFTFSTDEIWLYEDRTFKRKIKFVDGTPVNQHPCKSKKSTKYNPLDASTSNNSKT